MRTWPGQILVGAIDTSVNLRWCYNSWEESRGFMSARCFAFADDNCTRKLILATGNEQIHDFPPLRKRRTARQRCSPQEYTDCRWWWWWWTPLEDSFPVIRVVSLSLPTLFLPPVEYYYVRAHGSLSGKRERERLRNGDSQRERERNSVVCNSPINTEKNEERWEEERGRWMYTQEQQLTVYI